MKGWQSNLPPLQSCRKELEGITPLYMAQPRRRSGACAAYMAAHPWSAAAVFARRATRVALRSTDLTAFLFMAQRFYGTFVHSDERGDDHAECDDGEEEKVLDDADDKEMRPELADPVGLAT